MDAGHLVEDSCVGQEKLINHAICQLRLHGGKAH
jgi:hypothetical protein